MKFTTIAFAAAMLLPLAHPAFAKDATDGESGGIAVQTMICNQLYVHHPAADVAYKPGMDAQGNPVAPADLPGQNAVGLPDYIEVPLTVDLAKRLQQPVTKGAEMETVIGNLRLYKDGRVTYNGQDVQPQASAMCGKDLKTGDADAQEVAPVYSQMNSAVTPAAGSVAPSSTSFPPPAPIPGKVELSDGAAHFTPKSVVPVTSATPLMTTPMVGATQ